VRDRGSGGPSQAAENHQVVTRRVLLRSAAVAALGTPLAAACAQPSTEPRRPPRIGFLSISSEASFHDFLAGGPTYKRENSFLGGLEDALGYRDGQTIQIDYRWGGSNDQKVLGPLADELVAFPDMRLFVAHANASTIALKTRTKLPIVMANTNEPVEMKLVDSLANPGANITGIAISNSQFTAKRVELLKEMVPHIATIGHVIGATTVSNVSTDAAIVAAKQLGLRLELIAPASADELEAAFRRAVDAGVQGIVTGADPFSQDEEKKILALILRYHLPAVHYFRSYTDDGSVATLKQAPGLFAAAARYVDRILKGAKPATLPVEIWAGAELIINTTAARAIGVEIPAAVIARATEVVR
jgi:putative ABC transport system substrate-binding protein